MVLEVYLYPAILQAFKDDVLSLPVTPEDQSNLANHSQCKQRCNIPTPFGIWVANTLLLRKPLQMGSSYFIFYYLFSIPLLALVVLDYRFVWIEFGGQRHLSDAQIFRLESPPCPPTARRDVHQYIMEKAHIGNACCLFLIMSCT